MIKGIGIVKCVYVSPELDQYWTNDYRMYGPGGDGRTKLDPVQDRLLNCAHQSSG